LVLADTQADQASDTTQKAFPLRLRPTPRVLAWSDPEWTEPASPTRLLSLIVGLALAALVVTGALYLSTLSWVGTDRSPLALSILRTQITGGGNQLLVYLLAAASVVYLLARRPTRRRIVTGAIAIGGGALLGGAVLLWVAVTNAIGVALSVTTSVWAVAGFAGAALGIASLWSNPGWRTIGNVFAVIFILLAGTLGINADFGLDPTIGDLAGVSTLNKITVPDIKSTATPEPIPSVLAGGALWANWVPPKDMPAVGSIGQVPIPGTISGFNARPAGLYLPPAALVKNPPALPLVIMMMGNPGNPDPSFHQRILDAMETSHEGLAPIVIVADQLGNPSADPLCLNTANYGNAETYITQDVVNWARSNLRILQDPAHTTIAGYSNGGECALYFGAKYPNIFGNVLDISGETIPGADKYAAVLSKVFHGDSAAYRATWPINILPHGTYPDTLAIFTAGSDDTSFRTAALRINSETAAVGWKSTYYEIPNGGHALGALNGGLTEGYSLLYPRLGLTAPPGTPSAVPTPTPTATATPTRTATPTAGAAAKK
jgi:poly(3-hydroxybutyrate) depolymerase